MAKNLKKQKRSFLQVDPTSQVVLKVISLVTFIIPFTWLFFEDPTKRFGKLANGSTLTEINDIGIAVCASLIVVACFLFIFSFPYFRNLKAAPLGIIASIVLGVSGSYLFLWMRLMVYWTS